MREYPYLILNFIFPQINIRASDGGGKSQTINDLKIIFVDMDGQPYFTDTTFTASFTGMTNHGI